MPKWRQIQRTDGSYELVPVEDAPKGAPRLQIMGARVRDAYLSHVDGRTVVTSERQERELMRRHNVVRTGDYGPNDGKEYFARQTAEQRAFLDGTSAAHKKEVRSTIVETLQRLDQGQAPAKPRREGELPHER